MKWSKALLYDIDFRTRICGDESPHLTPPLPGELALRLGALIAVDEFNLLDRQSGLNECRILLYPVLEIKSSHLVLKKTIMKFFWVLESVT